MLKLFLMNKIKLKRIRFEDAEIIQMELQTKLSSTRIGGNK